MQSEEWSKFTAKPATPPPSPVTETDSDAELINQLIVVREDLENLKAMQDAIEDEIVGRILRGNGQFIRSERTDGSIIAAKLTKRTRRTVDKKALEHELAGITDSTTLPSIVKREYTIRPAAIDNSKLTAEEAELLAKVLRTSETNVIELMTVPASIPVSE